MKLFASVSRRSLGRPAFFSVLLLSVVGVGCLSNSSDKQVGEESLSPSDSTQFAGDSGTAPEALWRNYKIPLRSQINGETYTVVVKDEVVTFIHDGIQVPSVPADILARAGSAYYEIIVPPNSTRASLNLDTSNGTYRTWYSGGRSLIDLVLGAVSVLFALAFLTTGFFLLRVARQRRDLNDSRLRQLGARESERTHLAAELHDGPVQDLQFVMRSYFGTLSNAASKGAVQLLDIQSKLEGVTAALRNICVDLRPPVLAHFGLVYAVRSYADKFATRMPETTIHVDVVEEDSIEDEQLSLALFRIFQESLSNIEKHADADNVFVTLHIDSRWVEFIVKDDGAGFVVPRRLEAFEEEGHLGLSGLSQRAEAVGGVFEVRSSPNLGTTIRVVARKLSQDERVRARESLEVA